jgi:hypothetical protein
MMTPGEAKARAWLALVAAIAYLLGSVMGVWAQGHC